MSELPLLGPRGSGPVADPLGRVYTPFDLAEAIVRQLPDVPNALPTVDATRFTVLDQSVGGGSLLRAALKRWPYATTYGIDIDPEAPGLSGVSWYGFVGDYLDPAMYGVLPRMDLNVGNPPFGKAVGAQVTAKHVQRAILSANTTALILPVQVLCQSVFRRAVEGHPAPEVWWIAGRPWPNVREVAVFVWGQGSKPGTHRVLEGC